ncbi:DUF1801 domain-containing protein [Lacibacter luteus]|uniref:DUF1801 domain-containing protein n=1 Tax=Lacibacter luteus TaxID=2508719 RepID=A0A4Q1CEL7_9BACT|nr:DUF1801 domain-containing protein [Lacibacter luteus]RXK58314.1 DUF1801 domain-containing protein [Lacibacter luteus]
MNRLVDEYIESLPDEKRAIAEQLREMILTLIPHVQEKLSFKIPFYHYHGMFCYLNEVKDGIDLGLCRGKDLVDVLPQLEQGKRVMVASVIIRSKKEIQTKQIEEVLLTAANWQEEAKRLKISMINAKKKKV